MTHKDEWHFTESVNLVDVLSHICAKANVYFSKSLRGDTSYKDKRDLVYRRTANE